MTFLDISFFFVVEKSITHEISPTFLATQAVRSVVSCINNNVIENSSRLKSPPSLHTDFSCKQQFF